MTAAARKEQEEVRLEPPPLVRKAVETAALVETLRSDLIRLQVREAAGRIALTRTVLALAAERSALRRGLRQAASARPRPRWPAPVLRLPRQLVRLGLPGQALLVAASGAWRFSGRPLYDLRHIAAYLRRGADPAVAPASLFDQAWYLASNPDVAASGLSPLAHYLATGRREGRAPHLLFDPAFYAEQNGEALAQSGLAPLVHFMRTGAVTGRNPHPLFDLAYYAVQLPDLPPGEDLVGHYVREGWKSGLSPHPLFDPAWYVAQAPAAAGAAPLLHYLAEGAAAGLSPHPLFDPAWYRTQAPDAGEGVALVRHYLAVGGGRGLSPSPFFDPQHYLAQRGAAIAPGADPLIDYLLEGACTVAEPAPGFSTAAYLAANVELVVEGVTPLAHWARTASDRRVGD